MRSLVGRVGRLRRRSEPPSVRASALQEGVRLSGGQVVLLVERDPAARTVRVVPSFGEALHLGADDEVAVSW